MANPNPAITPELKFMFDCPDGASAEDQRAALMGNPAVLLAHDCPWAIALKGFESGNTHGQGGDFKVFYAGLFEYFMTQFLVMSNEVSKLTPWWVIKLSRYTKWTTDLKDTAFDFSPCTPVEMVKRLAAHMHKMSDRQRELDMNDLLPYSLRVGLG